MPEHHLAGIIGQCLLAWRAVVAEFDSVDRAVQPRFFCAVRVPEQHLEPLNPSLAVFWRDGERLAAGHEHILQHFLARRGEHGGLLALLQAGLDGL